MQREQAWSRTPGAESLPVDFAGVEEKVKRLNAERLTAIRQRLAEKEVTDLTFRRKYYRNYQKHFMAFYLLFGFGCMLKYFSVFTLRTHHLRLNALEERSAGLIFQCLEDKAAIIHKKRNIDPHLEALERKYPGVTRDLDYDTQSRFWVPFDVRFPVALGLRYSVKSNRAMRHAIVSPSANIVPI